MHTNNSLLLEILQHEGAASISTCLGAEQHVTATWNSYIKLNSSGELLIPVGGYIKTETNIKLGSKVMMLIASKNVAGKHSLGTGLRISGSAEFFTNGSDFDETKKRFHWIRAVMVVTIEKSEQLL